MPYKQQTPLHFLQEQERSEIILHVTLCYGFKNLTKALYTSFFFLVLWQKLKELKKYDIGNLGLKYARSKTKQENE